MFDCIFVEVCDEETHARSGAYRHDGSDSFPLFANGASESGAQGPKIGFIGPMTGDYANYGTLCNNAVKLAVEEYNAKGGIAGKLPVTLISEDSEGTVEKGLSAIEKLSSSDKINALIGPVFTGVSFAVGQRVQSEGIPMITPSATHKDITNIGNYVFRTVVSDGLQGKSPASISMRCSAIATSLSCMPRMTTVRGCSKV